MPSWKKVLISGSDAALNSLNITAALTASGIIYPSVDGTSGQVLTTDGSGHLSFTTVSSGETGTGASAKLAQTAAATTWSFSHNLNEKFPAVTIYDSNDEVIIPQKIDAVDNNNMLVYFSTPRTGTAAAVVGGTTVSASYSSTAVTASYALTASYLEGFASSFPYTGSAEITGSFGVTGSTYLGKSSADRIIVTGSQYIKDGTLVVLANNTVMDDYVDGYFDPGQAIIASGSVTATHGFSGSLYGNADTSTTASYALTASYLEGYISPFPYTGSAEITGSLEVTGSVSSTGGFTGSLQGNADTSTSASYAANSTSASYASNATSSSYALNSTSSSYSVSASYADNATSASHALTAVTSSYAISASYATTASFALSSQNAQDILIYVKNTTGVQIDKGTVVRILDSTGDTALIATASYDSEGLSANTLGITNQNILNDGFGYVMTEGKFLGLDTGTYEAGQLLYLGAGGTLTGTAPVAPLHSVRLGQVLRVQQNNGSMYVRIDNGYELGELHNVKDTSNGNSHGDLLVKSGSVWTNTKQLSGSYGLTGSLSATSFVGTLTGNASTATTASHALTASSLNPLYQNVELHGNLQVYGTSSFTYVTSSQLDVQQSFISVNVFEPAERFGGIKVYDSGSSTATASLAWDSLHNHWVYENVSGSTYSGGMLLAGPRNTGSLGDEPTLTRWMVARSDGGDHLENTQIYSSGSITQITGSLTVTQGITGSLSGNATTATSASYATTSTNATNATNATDFVVSSTLQLNESLTDYAAIGSTVSGVNNLYDRTVETYTAAFCKYTLYKGTNARAGEFMTVWNGSTVTYTDTSTTDIGDTSSVTFTSAIATGNIQINVTTSTSGWTIKSTVTYI